jgi:hypothetical protein
MNTDSINLISKRRRCSWGIFLCKKWFRTQFIISQSQATNICKPKHEIYKNGRKRFQTLNTLKMMKLSIKFNRQ